MKPKLATRTLQVGCANGQNQGNVTQPQIFYIFFILRRRSSTNTSKLPSYSSLHQCRRHRHNEEQDRGNGLQDHILDYERREQQAREERVNEKRRRREEEERNAHLQEEARHQEQANQAREALHAQQQVYEEYARPAWVARQEEEARVEQRHEM